jgi:hypothetical protein
MANKLLIYVAGTKAADTKVYVELGEGAVYRIGLLQKLRFKVSSDDILPTLEVAIPALNFYIEDLPKPDPNVVVIELDEFITLCGGHLEFRVRSGCKVLVGEKQAQALFKVYLDVEAGKKSSLTLFKNGDPGVVLPDWVTVCEPNVEPAIEKKAEKVEYTWTNTEFDKVEPEKTNEEK